MSNGGNIALTVNVGEVRLDPLDVTKVAWGGNLADMNQYAWANGTTGNDTFSAVAGTSDISSATQALMVRDQRGVNVDLGAGNDTATGSAYGDNFSMGAGTNYVDGGTNLGTTPWGGKAIDSMDVYVMAGATPALTAAVVAAVTVTTLDASSGSDTDKAAFAAGYTSKIVAGSEIDYVKNIENVNVQVWNDANHNGQKEWYQDQSKNEVTYGRNIALALNVGEIQLKPGDPTMTNWGSKLSDQNQYAWANGTTGNDTFSAAAGSSDISSATQALMVRDQRGASADMGAGNDTVVGSVYGDNFTMGSGTNYVDGGTNLGTDSWGNKAQDLLNIFVANSTEASAVTVTALDGSSADATDIAARSQGYTSKVVAGSEIDYVKNVENINIQIWTDTNGNGQKDWNSDPALNEMSNGGNIALVVNVGEVRVDPSLPDHVLGDSSATGLLSNQWTFAWANGTAGSDNFSAAVGTTAITQATQDLMATNQRGVNVDMGAGNDTATGSSYGDFFTMGSGVNYVDGGTNQGVQPGSTLVVAIDVLNVVVSSTADAAAVSVVQLNGSMSGDDLAAFTSNYQFKVVSAASGETDYLKDVERINIKVWTDANSNGAVNNGELVNYGARALAPYIAENVPNATNGPFLGFALGSQFADQIDGTAVLTALGKTLNAANPFGVYISSLGGNDTVVGTAGYDITAVSQYGSHLVDGGTDAGYYYYTAGTPVIVSDQYRLWEQHSSVVDASKSNGGLVGGDFKAGNYRLVNLQDWSAFGTDSLDHLSSAAVGELKDKMNSSSISTTDVANIAATASQLNLIGTSGNGYTWAVVKYDAATPGATLLGVDFLKGIEGLQFGLWYDFNHNDSVNGNNTNETVTVSNVTIAADAYTLAESDKTWLNVNVGGSTKSYAGVVNGTSFTDTIDLSGLTAPVYQLAGAGFRVADYAGNDSVLGSGGDDLFGLGVGDDTIDGAGGTDAAAIFWKPDASATLSQAASKDAITGITTITVSQTKASTTTALFTLVNDGSNAHWTFQTSGSSADAFIRPTGSSSLSVGTDLLLNVESVDVYLQSAVAFSTGIVSTTTPMEITLIGVV
ncbi:MAG: hypothetical protein WCN21_11380 [Comamonadaceae bacterium]